ncbi:hypothetical protein DE146DRAFT_755817 [Phaeosphaeria sp. MPI-PUGE-AT-0046c]|nr:hypothetical protein DE146DRAFT_755817 [Phaeosphaeria sp. MPI-PUGE-AT-0046c]
MDEPSLPLIATDQPDWPATATIARASQKKRQRMEYESEHEMIRVDGPAYKRASMSPSADRKDSKQEAPIVIKDFAISSPSVPGAGEGYSIDAWAQSMRLAMGNESTDDDNKSDDSLETVKPIKIAGLKGKGPRMFDGDMSASNSNESFTTALSRRGPLEGMISQRYDISPHPSDSVSQNTPTTSTQDKQRAVPPTNLAQASYRTIPFINPQSPVSSKPPSRLSRHSSSHPPPNIITTPPSPPARLDMTAIRATMAEHQVNLLAADALRQPGRQRQQEIEQMSV